MGAELYPAQFNGPRATGGVIRYAVLVKADRARDRSNWNRTDDQCVNLEGAKN